MVRTYIIKKWLADKKQIPEQFEGQIIQTTKKALLIEITNCDEFCKNFLNYLEDAKVTEWPSDPCSGCLGRHKRDCLTEWFPKSEITVGGK